MHPSFRRFQGGLRSPYSTYDTVRSTPAFAQLPIVVATRQTDDCHVDASQLVGHSPQRPESNLPTARRILRQPRSIAGGETVLSACPLPALPRPCLGCQQDAPPPPAATPWYPRRCDAYVPSPSYQRQSHEAPFFRRLDRLAVYDSCTGSPLPPFTSANFRTKGLIDLLPDALVLPLAEVLVHCLPRRKVMWEHPPWTTCP